MRKTVVIVILLVIGMKMGVDYLFSEKFQDYGDKTKKPWTCQTNIYIGEFMNLMSHYKQAAYYFQKAADRCPDTPLAEEADFEYARALDSNGVRSDAVQAYQAFIEKYPNSERAKLASKSIAILR